MQKAWLLVVTCMHLVVAHVSVMFGACNLDVSVPATTEECRRAQEEVISVLAAWAHGPNATSFPLDRRREPPLDYVKMWSSYP